MTTDEYARLLMPQIKETLKMIIDAKTPKEIVEAKEMAEYHSRRIDRWIYQGMTEDALNHEVKEILKSPPAHSQPAEAISTFQMDKSISEKWIEFWRKFNSIT